MRSTCCCRWLPARCLVLGVARRLAVDVERADVGRREHRAPPPRRAPRWTGCVPPLPADGVPGLRKPIAHTVAAITASTSTTTTVSMTRLVPPRSRPHWQRAAAPGVLRAAAVGRHRERAGRRRVRGGAAVPAVGLPGVGVVRVRVPVAAHSRAGPGTRAARPAGRGLGERRRRRHHGEGVRESPGDWIGGPCLVGRCSSARVITLSRADETSAETWRGVQTTPSETGAAGSLVGSSPGQ